MIEKISPEMAEIILTDVNKIVFPNEFIAEIIFLNEVLTTIARNIYTIKIIVSTYLDNSSQSYTKYKNGIEIRPTDKKLRNTRNEDSYNFPCLYTQVLFYYNTYQ